MMGEWWTWDSVYYSVIEGYCLGDRGTSRLATLDALRRHPEYAHLVRERIAQLQAQAADLTAVLLEV